MSSPLSKHVQNIKMSPTLDIAQRANALKASGRDIIKLSVGEPDFDTPDYIKQAAIQAIIDGKTKYVPVDGIPELKQAVVQKLYQDHALEYSPSQVVVSTGAKQALINCMLALLGEGDEVIIPSPYWVSYPDMVQFTGATPVLLPTTFSQKYKIDPQQLHDAITPLTKMLLLNSPHNPSGMVYARKEWEALAEILLAHPRIYILTDDIYEKLYWAKEPICHLATVCPELRNRILMVNGVSKSYAMTGWRIGYVTGPSEIIQAIKNIQSQSTSCANSIAQYAALAALTTPNPWLHQMSEIFEKRHAFLYNQLKKISDIRLHFSEATFYSYPDFSNYFGNHRRWQNDVAFTQGLLEEKGVAIVPGTAFGTPGSLRISFAIEEPSLEEAIVRLNDYLKGTI